MLNTNELSGNALNLGIFSSVLREHDLSQLASCETH